MSENAWLDPTRFEHPCTFIRREPFPFRAAHGLLPDAARAELDRDFLKYESTGFFPYDEKECGASIREAVNALTSRAFVDALGGRLGIGDFGRYPVIVHVCRYYNKRHGTIHTD